jgi:mRNA interferase MazF
MTRVEEKPPWVKPQITAAPKIRQIYWCDYWKDARLPEMWKTRPAIVISYRNTLYGPCLVVPTSTEPANASNEWAQLLSISLEGNGVVSWAVCNHLATVSASRFIQFNQGMVWLPKEDFDRVLAKVMKWLPKPFGG